MSCSQHVIRRHVVRRAVGPAAWFAVFVGCAAMCAAGCSTVIDPEGTGGMGGSGGSGAGGMGGGTGGSAASRFPCTEDGILAAIAEGGGPHTFACDGRTTVTTTAEIVIDNDVILDGSGNLLVSGDESHRVFTVGAGMTVGLQNLSVIGGNVDTAGGGIYNDSAADLTLTNCTVAANVGVDGGGGIYNVDRAALTLIDSTVAGNQGWAGGGIFNLDGATATLMNSTVSGNTGVGGGGSVNSAAAMTLVNSTVSGNTAAGAAAVFNLSGATLAMTNSTLSGNTATNTGDDGVSIYNDDTSSLTLTNNVIDGDCFSLAVTSGGYNIESPGDTCSLSAIGDQRSVTAGQLNLGPLQQNGGPTATHAPRPGSEAIDKIDPSDCDVATDQRGIDRPQGSACDIGSVEVVP